MKVTIFSLTSCTDFAGTLARSNAAFMAILAKSGAETEARLERNEPIGVRAAPSITVSLISPRDLEIEKLRWIFSKVGLLISKIRYVFKKN